MAFSETPLLSPTFSFPVDDPVNNAPAISTDDDEDTLRRVAQRFGATSGNFGYEGHGVESDSYSDDDSSAGDDITYLRRLQEQYLPPSAVAAASKIPETPPIVKPIRSFPPSDTDNDEDFETLRAIQRRFAYYRSEATPNVFSPEISSAVSAETSEDDPHNLSASLVIYEEQQKHGCVGLQSAGDEAPTAALPYTSLRNREMNEDYPAHGHINFNEEDGPCSLSMRQFITSKFPKSVQNFVDALKKNRSCQRFIRAKLVEIEAKIEVNRKLKERIKCLLDFHTAYRRKVGSSLCQKRDPRVRLISLQKKRAYKGAKENSKNSSVSYISPEENPQVSNYKMVMSRYPFPLKERQWSNAEKGELLKGVKQQYQEMLFLNCMKLGSEFDGSIDSIIASTIDSANHQATPEILRSFLPLVNWNRLASMYLPRRSGPSCESRWLNQEDLMINHNPWTLLEDKRLLFIVQERGLYNWIEIAVTLGTNRTPFQCLARYQRSLNPHILNREWTNEEDAKLYSSVEAFGDNNWQIVASHLDGRTSSQCSVRWRNSLLPGRKRVGRWSIEEDKRLKVSVILFGAKNWNKIAQFVPGRTQTQCRERWLNCLDPSLNLERWTAEEDSKLLAAIEEHGHSWSKVAVCLPGRTDNHCRRRWKSLLPHEVPMLKAAQQLKKTVLISNFVGRESERPALGPNDFTPIISLGAPTAETYAEVSRKRSRTKQSRKSRDITERDEENSRDSLSISADAAQFDLPLETVTPPVSDNARIKGRRKRYQGHKS